MVVPMHPGGSQRAAYLQHCAEQARRCRRLLLRSDSAAAGGAGTGRMGARGGLDESDRDLHDVFAELRRTCVTPCCPRPIWQWKGR